MNTKEAYQQKMEARMAELQADMQKLRAKADAASANTKLALTEQVNELRAKQDAATQKLDAIRNARDKSWEDLKAGVDKAFDDVSRSVRAAKEQLIH